MRFLLLLFILLGSIPVAACDVNLFAIMAGTTKQDAFSEAITGLAKAVKALNDRVIDKKFVEKSTVEFMNQWLAFANSFHLFPPEWGRKDPAWSDKFRDLGMIIGEIRRQLGNDQVLAHDSMLRFSRRLSLLYEYMPMDDRSRLLLQFTRCFDGLWEAFFARNQALLKLHAAEFKSNCEKLNSLIGGQEREQVITLADWAEKVRVMSTQINAFQTVTLRMTLSGAEAEFVSLNAKLSAALKPTTP